jgi:hypothetical protein
MAEDIAFLFSVFNTAAMGKTGDGGPILQGDSLLRPAPYLLGYDAFLNLIVVSRPLVRPGDPIRLGSRTKEIIPRRTPGKVTG